MKYQSLLFLLNVLQTLNFFSLLNDTWSVQTVNATTGPSPLSFLLEPEIFIPAQLHLIFFRVIPKYPKQSILSTKLVYFEYNQRGYL
mgnify:CR=1 FL=1